MTQDYSGTAGTDNRPLDIVVEALTLNDREINTLLTVRQVDVPEETEPGELGFVGDSGLDADGWWYREPGGDLHEITSIEYHGGSVETITEWYREPDVEFNVAITDTNSPVDAGETLTVDYQIENTGLETGTQDIELWAVELDLQGIENLEDTDAGVTVDGGETETGTLEWNTEEGDEDRDWQVRVQSEDDSDTVQVTVEQGQEGALLTTGSDGLFKIDSEDMVVAESNTAIDGRAVKVIDGRVFVGTADNETIEVDPDTLDQVGTAFTEHTSLVFGIGNIGTRLFSVDLDGFVFEIDISDMTEVNSYSLDSDWFYGIGSDETHIYPCGRDQDLVHKVEPDAMSQEHTYDGHSDFPQDAVTLGDNVFSCSNNVRKLTKSDLSATGSFRLSGTGRALTLLDGDLFCGDQSGRIYRIDVADMTEIDQFSDHTNSVEGVTAFDGSVFGCDTDGNVRRADVDTMDQTGFVDVSSSFLLDITHI